MLKRLLALLPTELGDALIRAKVKLTPSLRDDRIEVSVARTEEDLVSKDKFTP
jgi:hypothetical protein